MAKKTERRGFSFVYLLYAVGAIIAQKVNVLCMCCCWRDNRTESECACALETATWTRCEWTWRVGAATLRRNVQGAWRQTVLNMDAVRLTERQEVVWVVLIYLEIDYAGVSFLMTSFFLFQLLSVVWNAATSTNLGSNWFTCFRMGWSRGFFRLAVFHWGFYWHCGSLPAMR